MSFLFYPSPTHPHLHSFPTRRSSDLTGQIIICHRESARSTMEIKIGVKQTQREITFETDEDPKDLAARIEEKVQSDGLLTFSDTKGRQIFVPAGSLRYIEVSAETNRRDGFNA